MGVTSVWRKAVFGGSLIAIPLLAFYVALGAPGATDLIGMAMGEPRVTPGFLGVANFGRWRLICVRGPARQDTLNSATGTGVAPEVRKGGAANSCRVNQEMRASRPAEPPGQVIIAINFSLIGPKRVPAAMLRLPVTARPGDAIGLRFGDGAAVQTIVRDCAPTECLAAGTLTQSDWDHLSAAKNLQVSFPAAGRQWVLLDLPVEGLSAAIDALKRAEIPPDL
jgi:invasion protein IalB